MTTPPAPWALKAAELLDDRRWHHIDEIVGYAGAAVPPGVAYRHGEKNRTLCHPGRVERKRGSRDTAIATGRRRLVKEALRARRRTGSIEQRGVGAQAEFRKVGQ